MSGTGGDLVRELLTESLAAWRVAGAVERRSDGAILVRCSDRSIRIEPATEKMFRWTVAIDGRERRSISLVGVLRQVREAIDPGYAASRVRVTVAPLLP